MRIARAFFCALGKREAEGDQGLSQAPYLTGKIKKRQKSLPQSKRPKIHLL
jgi:hypothetical protein